jgi:hypothetical protein
MARPNFVTQITQILETFAECDEPATPAGQISSLASEIAEYRADVGIPAHGRHASIAITALENAALFMSCKLPAQLMDALTFDGGEHMQGYVRHELSTAALHIAQLPQ